jgi:hypothetical protein
MAPCHYAWSVTVHADARCQGQSVGRVPPSSPRARRPLPAPHTMPPGLAFSPRPASTPLPPGFTDCAAMFHHSRWKALWPDFEDPPSLPHVQFSPQHSPASGSWATSLLPLLLCAPLVKPRLRDILSKTLAPPAGFGPPGTCHSMCT